MKKKNQKGFTLVEVIVVAVIVAALAAVAVGVYLSYVTDARNNAARNAGATISSFCGACRNASETLGGYASGTAIVAGGTITCTNATSVIVPADIDVTITNGNPSTVVVNNEKIPATTFTFNF